MATKGGKDSGRKSARGRRGGSTASTTGDAVPAAGQPLIDLDFVRGLIDAVDGSGIDSLEISRAGTKIRVSKTPPPAPVSAHAAAPAAAMQVLPTAPPAPVNGGAAAPAPAAAAPAEEEGEAAAEAKADLYEVTSPMVGTYYQAPAPDAPPYVEPGTPVSKGQTLCILEAMKLMNEMESEVDGVVREVLVENGEPVEYGQVLFRIELSGSGAH